MPGSCGHRAGRGGDDADRVGAEALGRAVKAAKDPYGLGHRFGRKEIRAEHAFAQASDFAILVNRVQFAASQASNFQADRVGADINGGKDGHGMLMARTATFVVNHHSSHKSNWQRNGKRSSEEQVRDVDFARRK